MRLRATFDQLRPGDVVIQADDADVGPVIVDQAADGGDRVQLVKPRRAVAERALYRDFADEYLVERADIPEPAAPAPVVDVTQLATGEPRRAVDDDGTLSRLALGVPRMTAVYSLETKGFPAPGGRDQDRLPECGDVVLIASGGFWRAAVVTDVGRKNVRIAYTTPGGVRAARGSYLRVFRPHLPMASAYVVTGEIWAQRAIAGE